MSVKAALSCTQGRTDGRRERGREGGEGGGGINDGEEEKRANMREVKQIQCLYLLHLRIRAGIKHDRQKR